MDKGKILVLAIGIDGGKNGSVAFIIATATKNIKGKVNVSIKKMGHVNVSDDISKTIQDLNGMLNVYLKEFNRSIDRVKSKGDYKIAIVGASEKNWSRPEMGRQSAYNFGYFCGILDGWLYGKIQELKEHSINDIQSKDDFGAIRIELKSFAGAVWRKGLGILSSNKYKTRKDSAYKKLQEIIGNSNKKNLKQFDYKKIPKRSADAYLIALYAIKELLSD